MFFDQTAIFIAIVRNNDWLHRTLMMIPLEASTSNNKCWGWWIMLSITADLLCRGRWPIKKGDKPSVCTVGNAQSNLSMFRPFTPGEIWWMRREEIQRYVGHRRSWLQWWDAGNDSKIIKENNNQQLSRYASDIQWGLVKSWFLLNDFLDLWE